MVLARDLNDLIHRYGSAIHPPAEADIVLSLRVGACGHKLPGIFIQRGFLIDFPILAVRPNLDADGFAHHVFSDRDGSFRAGLGSAAKDVNFAFGGHINVDGPKEFITRLVFAIVKQLEDARTDRLDDRVGGLILVPCSGRDGERLGKDLDTSRRTRRADPRAVDTDIHVVAVWPLNGRPDGLGPNYYWELFP